MRRVPRESLVPILALAAASGSAWAQDSGVTGADGGPIVVGETLGDLRFFELRSLNAAFDFTSRFRQDEIKQRGQPDATDTEQLFRGTIDFFTESYIGHKNLIDLTADFRLGLESQDITSQTLDGESSELSFTNLYDVSALILGEGPVPVTAYSRRDEALIDREFSGSIRAVSSETGAIARFKSDIAPTWIQYFHREQNESDQLDTINSGLVQDTAVIHSEYRFDTHQRLEFNYIFDHIDETQGFNFENMYDRHDGELVHTISFGPENHHDLRSSLRYYEQSGEFGQRVLRLDEQLTMRHTDRFEMRYNLDAETREQGGDEQQLVLGSATARHRLFDSLTSGATVGGSHLALSGDGFTSDDVFINGTLDYTKQVPLGRLDAGASLGLNVQDNSDRGGTLSILDQPGTFRDPFPIILSRTRIIASSVRVTDTARLRTFIEDVDYSLREFPDRVEVRRVVGGAIIDGQTVLISYDIGPEPENQIDTTSASLTIRYTFERGWFQGLSLYSTLRQTDHSLSADDPGQFVLDDFTSLLYGAEYRIGDISLSAEREHRDSTVSPYDSTRLEARFDRRLGRNSTLTLSLYHELIEYTDDNNELELLRATARWTERLVSNLDLSIRLQYRDEHETIGGDVTGFEQALELSWHYRQTSIFTSFRNAMLDGDTVDRMSQTFVFGFRRTF